MDKIGKIILGLGGLVLTGLAIIIKTANKEPQKYSGDWIKNLTDTEWETEREIVRQQYCNPEYDISYRENLHQILWLFDKIKSDKEWAKKTPHGPSYHREHGYNLYKPD